MAKVQVRVSVDANLWSRLKYEGETDTQVQNRIMAVIARLVEIDPDPMAAIGRLQALGEVNCQVVEIGEEPIYEADDDEESNIEITNDEGITDVTQF